MSPVPYTLSAVTKENGIFAMIARAITWSAALLATQLRSGSSVTGRMDFANVMPKIAKNPHR
jgi:hypothetical protein